MYHIQDGAKGGLQYWGHETFCLVLLFRIIALFFIWTTVNLILPTLYTTYEIDVFPTLLNAFKNKYKILEPSIAFLFNKSKSISKSAVSITYD